MYKVTNFDTSHCQALSASSKCVPLRNIGDISLAGVLIEFFNNSDAILNFEHIAMHCGLSRVILLF